LYYPNGAKLSANITFCTGTGGHLWWGSLKRRPELDNTNILKDVLGPDNPTFDVSKKIEDFICEHGGRCWSYIDHTKPYKPGNDSKANFNIGANIFKNSSLGAWGWTGTMGGVAGGGALIYRKI